MTRPSFDELRDFDRDAHGALSHRPGLIRSIIWSLLTVPAVLYLPPLISAFFTLNGGV